MILNLWYDFNHSGYNSVISVANKIETMSKTRNRSILAQRFLNQTGSIDLPKYLTEKSGGDKSFVHTVHFSLTSDALPRL